MATFTNINGKVRAQIRRAGHPTMTKTFDSTKEAEMWARKEESTIDSGKKVGVHGKTGVTFGEAIDRYIDEKKNIGKTASDILGYIKKGLGTILISKLSSDDIVLYIQRKNFGPMSGAIHFSFLCTVLKMAKIGWGYYVPEIIDTARGRLKILELIGNSVERTRRPTENEVKMLLTYKYPTPIPMADIIQFAIFSAMRQAEITRIKYKTLHKKKVGEDHHTVQINDRKHPKLKKGNHQIVPLLDEAYEIIERQPKDDDLIFPYNPSTIGQYFTNACKALGIEDLHFHDLRHEGTSRLFEMGYQIPEVALFTGHKDWKQLKRYTQLKPNELRRPGVKQAVKEVVEVPVTNMEMDTETLKEFKKFQVMMAMMKQTEAA